MIVLVPLAVSDIVSTNVPEPAAGEVEWVSGATYGIGDLRIRAINHRQYVAIQSHTGRTTPPESDPLFWRDLRATRRFAPFDYYRSTQATGTSNINYTVALGFANAVDLYGLEGSAVSLTVRQGLNGAVLFQETRPLFEESPGLYEYLFTPRRPISNVAFDPLPIHPQAHITIEVTGPAGVALGIAAIGNLRMAFDPTRGGVEYGSSATPRTTSSIKIDDFGEAVIVRRPFATDLDLRAVLDPKDGAYCVQLLQEVLDVPASVRALSGSDLSFDTYRWLSTFGLISGTVDASNPGQSKLTAKVQGFI